MRCSGSMADRLGGLVTQVMQYAHLPTAAAAAEVAKVDFDFDLDFDFERVKSTKCMKGICSNGRELCPEDRNGQDQSL